MHWVLSAALYFDQFCARTFSAVCSSARQASLSRPAEMAPRAAASQLGVMFSFGGLSASAMAVCSPSANVATAILWVKADMVFLVCGLPPAIPIRSIVDIRRRVVTYEMLIMDYCCHRGTQTGAAAAYLAGAGLSAFPG